VIPHIVVAAAVVLGSPHYVTDGQGFGAAHPSRIFNGGVPSGLVTQVHWTGWGKATARGRGLNPLYLPQGGYFDRRGRILLRAQKIGTCPDGTGPAYTQLWFRIPQWPGGPHGPWMKWSGSKTLCDHSQFSVASPPGYCGFVGRHDYAPGTVFDVMAYRMSCGRARRAAKVMRSSGCGSAGCTRAVAGLHCRLERQRRGVQAVAITTTHPAQRLACTRRAANFTGWLVR
jgi:hypothetical protein